MGPYVLQWISQHIDGLVQKRHNSIANALELCISCTNPLLWGLWWQMQVSRAWMRNYILQYSVGCCYISMPYISASATKFLIYEDFGARSRYLGHGYIITSISMLRDVNTQPCPRYLLLAPKSSFLRTQYYLLTVLMLRTTSIQQNAMLDTCKSMNCPKLIYTTNWCLNPWFNTMIVVKIVL